MDTQREIREMLQLVYNSLKERGFMDPLNQIWLYLMTRTKAISPPITMHVRRLWRTTGTTSAAAC